MLLSIAPELNIWSSGDILAIRAFNASSEFLCMDAIDLFRQSSVLSPTILNPRSSSTSSESMLEWDSKALKEILAEFTLKYSLNVDQVAVCQSVIDSLGNPNIDSPNPITLVHGGLPELNLSLLVFGSGKSFVISVLILLLSRLQTEGAFLPHESPFRIVISSNTNGLTATSGLLIC